ncbi:DUF3817 domain-containing protein [Allostreptomyces psammosilenae]|uniref:Integral membrane protein n=1 Tax=Allostreptomyces psammosilenae TaxID=1892865 RepID=A0A853A7G4_9ACTN|nr:DUF3817 domain-containing protein [Allostreptomyces psammosilenae]NYI06488.1 integral membrane protein [Allostreptomyces psammosilenae]
MSTAQSTTPATPATGDAGGPDSPRALGTLDRLRWVSLPEGISFLVLLVCSVLRRTIEWDLGVTVMGPIHGALFVLYVLFWLDAWSKRKWTVGRAALLFVLSVLPTGGLFAERSLAKEKRQALERAAAPAA